MCYASYHFLFGRFGASTFTVRLAEAFVPITLGGIAFIITAKLLRITELEQAFGMLRRKLAR